MITPQLERVGQVEVPFQSAFFLGDGFPMATPWAEREVPLARRQIANHPENLYMGFHTPLPASVRGVVCGIDYEAAPPQLL